MNLRSIWQHPGLILSSALSFALFFGCSTSTEQDGGLDGGPQHDAGMDAGPDAGQDSGMGCIPVGVGGCFVDADCCSGLTCNQNTNHCELGDSGMMMNCSMAGQTCTTIADCCAGFGLACNTPGDAGGMACGANTAIPTAKCVTDGNSCGGDAGACCSGNCISGSCVAWPVCGASTPNGSCGSGAAACANNYECCSNNVCDGGTCAQVCGKVLDPCSGSTPTGTCCGNSGYLCVGVNYCTNANPCAFAQCLAVVASGMSISLTPCGPPGSAVECDKGTFCTPGTVDPCAQAGLVCRGNGNIGVGTANGFVALTTCQLPSEFGACVPGGPACQPILNSSATNMQCLALGGTNSCLQPCVTAADCINPLNGCYQAGDAKACITDVGPNMNTSCTAAYTKCNSSGNKDGLCLEVPFSNGSGLVCIQEATDAGGEVGACCNGFGLTGSGNRQVGGLCTAPNICQGLFVINESQDWSPLCAQVCDPNPPAGADAGFPCDTDGGPRYCFFPGVAQSGNATGVCTPPCDALALNDAGGCPAAAAGNPTQVCTAAVILDFLGAHPTVSDTTVGVCTAEPNIQVLDLGAKCGPPGTACKQGTRCYAGGSGQQTCMHLCGPVGSLPNPGVDGGDNGCVVGEHCFPFIFGTVAPGSQSTKIGFCDTVLGDGGPA